ncbi:MAG: sulfatase [Planctomycetota bacterium]|nr:sulfatase [Planctomycetota bacterium]
MSDTPRKKCSHPNLLFVLVDQMRHMAMGCAGNGQVKTPNLDRLAAEGALFNHAVSNIPVCTPARACIFTGRFPLGNTVLTNNSMLPNEMPSMGKTLKEAGYSTGYIGKWHLSGEAYIGETQFNELENGYIPPGELRHGFDYWAVHHCSHAYWKARYYRDTPEPVEIDGWEPDEQTRLAIDFIRSHAVEDEEQRQPFALVLSWGPPHTPFVAPPEFRELYDPDSLELRNNVLCPPPGVPVTGELGEADAEETLREWTANYYGAVTNLDHNLGRLMVALDEQGIADETIVVFTSDHGEMLGSQGQLYKVQPWDESIRIPFIVRHPNSIPNGMQLDTLFSLPDILPTLLGLMDLPIPEDIEGDDLSSMLMGETDPTDRSALLLWVCSALTWGKKWTYVDDYRGLGAPKGFIRPYRGIRTRTHTYVRDRTGPWLLYDNERDPWQLENLIDSHGSKSIPPELEQELERWLERTDDRFEDTDYYIDLIDLETGLCTEPGGLKRG